MNGAQQTDTAGRIELVGVEKRFAGQRVLRGLSLSIPPGRITAIIGPSGSGKTILIKQIVGLLRPDAGQILVDGEDVTRLHLEDLRRLREKFGFLFQGGALFDSLSVFDNIAFPLREKTHLHEPVIVDLVERRLADVGLSDMGQKLPAELSGGMRKRAALARALIQSPEFAFFDEPTTGLDPILLRSIHRLIAAAHRQLGFTGVVVSHEIPEVFEIAHHVAMLDEGVIVEQGSVEEIKASTNPIVQRFLTGRGNGRDGGGER